MTDFIKHVRAFKHSPRLSDGSWSQDTSPWRPGKRFLSPFHDIGRLAEEAPLRRHREKPQARTRDRNGPVRSKRFLLVVVAAAAAFSVPTWAQSDEAIVFDLPAQPLEAALAQYFRSTGVQLLYDSNLTAGRRSRAVRGRHSPREALRLMLAGTGISVRYSRANAAILMSRSAPEGAPIVPLGTVTVRERAPETGPSPLERLAYYSALESALQSRLAEDARTERLAFRLTASVTVDGQGRIANPLVARSSGNREVDRRVVDVLASASVPPPPARLMQPLLVVLTGRP